MKKLSLLLSALAMIVLISCKEKEEEQINEATPTETTPQATEKESTKIKVSTDGVEYSDDKTNIEVSKDGAEITKD